MRHETTANSYDEVPYPNLAHGQSHPDRLATIASLVGLKPTPVERCRVLELGCAGGGNLIPMAYSLPQSEFAGLDGSARQIAEAQAAVADLGLTNITFRQMDILDVGPELGRFDYVIAHGVYSWVPEPVRDKILAICRQNLAPNGVAYVSYNTYPGWHMFNVVRDAMRFHTRHTAGARQQATEARDLLNFLTEAVPAEESAYGSFLQAYANTLLTKLGEAYSNQEALLLHDELEEVNEPVYIHQFLEHAARHGLQYLAEAEFSTVMLSNFPAQVGTALQKMATNTVELEQYMDFVRNRTFRQTLLCHQEMKLEQALKAETVMGLCVASQALPETPEPDVQARTVERFRGQKGAIFATDHPVTKAAMHYLARIAPQAAPFKELFGAAWAHVYGHAAVVQDKETVTADRQVLATNLLQAYSYSSTLVELHSYVPEFVLEVSERPVASLVARWQALNSRLVTNLRHERVTLDATGRYLLRYLDGQHDQADLLDNLAQLATAGKLLVQQEGTIVEEEREAREIMAKELAENLNWLAHAALLQA